MVNEEDVITAEKVIKAYLKTRDKRDEMRRRHKEELKPINEQLEKLGAWLHRKLLHDNLQNIRSKDGTAFLKEEVKVTVEDWDLAVGFIKANNAFDLLERRISKSAYEDYEREGITVPGVKVSREKEVHVQRK